MSSDAIVFVPFPSWGVRLVCPTDPKPSRIFPYRPENLHLTTPFGFASTSLLINKDCSPSQLLYGTPISPPLPLSPARFGLDPRVSLF